MSLRWPRARPWFALAMMVLVCIAAFTRFHEIGRRSLWFDEGVTLGMVRLPLAELLRETWKSVGLNNQIFYYLALRPWHLLGEDEGTLRAFSAAFSTGSVVLTCLLGRRLFGSAAGITAGLVLSVHYFAVRMAQDARSYGLTEFLVSLAAFFLARFVELDRRRDLAGWILASGLALYAHFFALFPIAAQVLSLALLKRATPARRRSLFAASLAILTLTLPIITLLSLAPSVVLAWVPPIDERRLLEVGATLAGGKGYLLLLHLILFAIALVRGREDPRAFRSWGIFLVLLWAAFPPVAMAILSVRQPILFARYVSMSIPAWALVVGIVVGPLIERRRLRALGLGLVAYFLLSEAHKLSDLDTDPFEDWRTPARAVAASTRLGDAIIYNSAWGGLTLGYYLDQSPRRPENLQRGPLLFSGTFDPADALARERVWVVLSRADVDFEARVDRLLSQSHPVISRGRFGFLDILLFDVRQRPEGDGTFGTPGR